MILQEVQCVWFTYLDPCLVGLVQQVRVFHHLAVLLHGTDGLVEADGQTDLDEVFAHAVLEEAPDGDRLLLFCGFGQAEATVDRGRGVELNLQKGEESS